MKGLKCVVTVVKCAIIAVAVLAGVAFQTVETRAEGDKEEVNGVTWIVEVEWDGNVAIAPADKDNIPKRCIIPETVNGLKVNYIAEGAFSNCKNLEEIVLSDSITGADDRAFKNCSELRKVRLSRKMTTLSNELFSGCTSLEEVVIPRGITVVGNQAFRSCANLSNVMLPESVAYISEQAFEGCTKLKSMRIPFSVVSIKSRAFANTGLTAIVIPRQVTDMQEDIFAGSHLLKNIFYLGTRLQWQSTGCRRLEDPGFSYGDYNDYDIQVHFLDFLLQTNPLSVTYQLNEESVKPLSVYDRNTLGRELTKRFVSYQWYVNSVNSNNSGSAILGANHYEYTPPVNEAGEKYYYCKITIHFLDLSFTYKTNTAAITLLGKRDNQDERDKNTWKVTFQCEDGFSVEPVYVPKNTALSKPDSGADDEYQKAVWYKDSEYNKLYDFSEPVTESMTLYGRMELDYTLLQSAVSEARGLLNYNEYIARYTVNSVQKFSEIVDNAEQAIIRKSIPSKEAMLNAINEVQNARNLLIIRPEERPVPHVKLGMAYVTLHGERLGIQEYTENIQFNSDEFINRYRDSKSSEQIIEIPMGESGFYELIVMDKFGDEHYLVFYYDKESKQIEKIEYSLLAYEIQKAQLLYEQTPYEKTNLVPGSLYASEAAHESLLMEIDKVKALSDNELTAEEIQDVITELKQAEEEFRKNMISVDWVTIKVEGSTVKVIPNEIYKLSVVQYNVDENENIATGFWNNWEGFSSQKYAQMTSGFVWENVPKGVYTFIITLRDQEGGYVWGIKTFTVGEGTCGETVMEENLQRQIEKAKQTLLSTKSAKDAKEGEYCVPDGIYDYLATAIEEAENLLKNENRTPAWVENAYAKLVSGELDFIKNKELKKVISHEAEIKVENGIISVYGEDLYKCSYTLGEYNTDASYINAGYRSFALDNGRGTAKVKYDGTYTIRMLFKDNAVEFRTVEVKDMLKVSEEDGSFVLSYYGEEDIVSTKYACEEGLAEYDYKTYRGFKEKLLVLGNGVYRIVVTFEGGKEEILNIKTESCKKPVILMEEGYLTVYDYGFNLQTVMYAKGHFTSWEDMYQSVYNTAQLNTPVSMKEFEKTEYTFYMIDENGNVYWDYVTISE